MKDQFKTNKKSINKNTRNHKPYAVNHFESLHNLSPIPKIQSKNILSLTRIHRDLNTSRMSVLSVSRLDRDEIFEISIFKAEDSLEPRTPLYHNPKFFGEINELNSSKHLLKDGSEQRKNIVGGTPIPRRRHISNENFDTLKPRKMKKKHLGKPPIPINSKISKLSQPENSNLYQRRLKQGEQRKSACNGNCVTPNLQNFRRPLAIKHESHPLKSLTKLMESIKINLLLKAYKVIKRLLNKNTRLTIITKILKFPVRCSFEDKIRRISNKLIYEFNHKKSISRVGQSPLLHPLKRSDDPMSVKNALLMRKTKDKLILLKKTKVKPLVKKLEERNLLKYTLRLPMIK